MSDAPCTAREAVDRARRMVNSGGQYLLGTGDYHPRNYLGVGEAAQQSLDLPWTNNEKGLMGSDCAGFAICWCWKIRRHRPGFNHGWWSTVEDDINVNSILEDAKHNKELAETTLLPALGYDRPIPGDLLCYPTFTTDSVKPHIGHVAIVEVVPAGYKPGRFDMLTVIQCHGPNGFKPGVVRTDGSLFVHHDGVWDGSNNSDRRCQIVRMKERT